MAKTIAIQPTGFEPPVAAAVAALAEYLPRLAPVEVQVHEARAALPPGREAQLVLGTVESLRGVRLGKLPESSELDDAFAILPKKGVLYLAGANPRSVLFAAYRLLEELGVVFLRPGPGGEIVPRKAKLALPARPIREEASYRHRGICIEGSPRLEHALNLLDWMAKHKMNAFQLQFRHAGVFWRRGYTLSPEMVASGEASTLSDADCITLDDRVIAKMKELGLMLHRVGHGWTAATLGYSGIDWNEAPDQEVPEERHGWVAEVKGRRALWRNEPTNTELCYSQPQVRAAFIDEVLRYARRHPEVDLLHVWLSDGDNNRCECAGCRAKEPTDWYVVLLNELGPRLQAEGSPARIVFLAYNDMLWPPQTEKLEVSNTVFMFAPMGRCYRHHLGDADCGDELEARRPSLNEMSRPFGNRAVSRLARSWKDWGTSDSFLFDYHQWAAVWRDGLGQDLGATMAADVKALAEVGLDGLISCQCVRAFYPLPYLANVMADTLWNARLSPNAHRRKVMEAAFGPHAEEAQRFFSGLVRATGGGSYDHRGAVRDADQVQLRKLVAYAERARKRFGRLAAGTRDQVRRVSLGLLALHAEQCARIFTARLAGLQKDGQRVAALRADYEQRLPELLADFAPWVDPKIAEPVREALAEAAREAR